MPLWKRLVIFGTSAGAGFALSIAIIVGCFAWYSSHHNPPETWNSSAIKASFDAVKVEGDDNHFEFYYLLDNTTNADYTLDESSTPTLVGKLKEQNSLTQPVGKELPLNYPIFIPSKQRGRYHISLLTYKYPGGKPKDGLGSEERSTYEKGLSKYVSEMFQNLDGFVLFDESHRYQINFPRGW